MVITGLKYCIFIPYFVLIFQLHIQQTTNQTCRFFPHFIFILPCYITGPCTPATIKQILYLNTLEKSFSTLNTNKCNRTSKAEPTKHSNELVKYSYCSSDSDKSHHNVSSITQNCKMLQSIPQHLSNQIKESKSFEFFFRHCYLQKINDFHGT